MTFMIYGLDAHERMPLEKVFKERVVEKSTAIPAERPVEEQERHGSAKRDGRQHLAVQAYNSVDQLPNEPSVLLAEQVMTAPVVTLPPEATISEALRQFQANDFRHVPVVTTADRLVGIVSERDYLRHLAGLTARYQPGIPQTSDALVAQIMTPRVLTAGVDTDVRYIARLFVERRVGAMPVMKDGELKGIITRSDVLGAVMRHFGLELWA